LTQEEGPFLNSKDKKKEKMDSKPTKKISQEREQAVDRVRSCSADDKQR
jgi:hypothetical protein